MLDRLKKRTRDPIQLGYQIVLESTGRVEAFNPKPEPVLDPAKTPHAVALGRLGGPKGGAARAASLGPRRHFAVAAAGAAARWGKK